ncbi:MAG TPA: HepT-like ribonuclease domain-containing protein, partial [Longimicrobium sp.]|nr:HepT-like ribonuclease domain-containing protein [Longimicrobium sp.]
EFEADEYRVLSVERLLEIMGEATKQLSPELRQRHPEIPWRQMAGMRDLLIHAYRNINPDEVWKAVSVSVPALLTAIEPLIQPLNEKDADEQ